MDKRELRLAIQEKFDHRRKLITENAAQRSENASLRARVQAADKVLHSKLGDIALDDCADKIVNMILEKAFAASMLVADQMADTGDYVVGIDIPSLHIRYRIAQLQMTHFDEGPLRMEMKHLNIKV